MDTRWERLPTDFPENAITNTQTHFNVGILSCVYMGAAASNHFAVCRGASINPSSADAGDTDMPACRPSLSGSKSDSSALCRTTGTPTPDIAVQSAVSSPIAPDRGESGPVLLSVGVTDRTQHNATIMNRIAFSHDSHDPEVATPTSLQVQREAKRTHTARPDTPRPDLKRPDTLHPDLKRPDTARPDLKRPDSVHPDAAASNSHQLRNRGVPSNARGCHPQTASLPIQRRQLRCTTTTAFRHRRATSGRGRLAIRRPTSSSYPTRSLSDLSFRLDIEQLPSRYRQLGSCRFQQQLGVTEQLQDPRQKLLAISRLQRSEQLSSVSLAITSPVQGQLTQAGSRYPASTLTAYHHSTDDCKSKRKPAHMNSKHRGAMHEPHWFHHTTATSAPHVSSVRVQASPSLPPISPEEGATTSGYHSEATEWQGLEPCRGASDSPQHPTSHGHCQSRVSYSRLQHPAVVQYDHRSAIKRRQDVRQRREEHARHVRALTQQSEARNWENNHNRLRWGDRGIGCTRLWQPTSHNDALPQITPDNQISEVPNWAERAVEGSTVEVDDGRSPSVNSLCPSPTPNSGFPFATPETPETIQNVFFQSEIAWKRQAALQTLRDNQLQAVEKQIRIKKEREFLARDEAASEEYMKREQNRLQAIADTQKEALNKKMVLYERRQQLVATAMQKAMEEAAIAKRRKLRLSDQAGDEYGGSCHPITDRLPGNSDWSKTSTLQCNAKSSETLTTYNESDAPDVNFPQTKVPMLEISKLVPNDQVSTDILIDIHDLEERVLTPTKFRSCSQKASVGAREMGTQTDSTRLLQRSAFTFPRMRDVNIGTENARRSNLTTYERMHKHSGSSKSSKLEDRPRWNAPKTDKLYLTQTEKDVMINQRARRRSIRRRLTEDTASDTDTDNRIRVNPARHRTRHTRTGSTSRGDQLTSLSCLRSESLFTSSMNATTTMMTPLDPRKTQRFGRLKQPGWWDPTSAWGPTRSRSLPRLHYPYVSTERALLQIGSCRLVSEQSPSNEGPCSFRSNTRRRDNGTDKEDEEPPLLGRSEEDVCRTCTTPPPSSGTAQHSTSTCSDDITQSSGQNQAHQTDALFKKSFTSRDTESELSLEAPLSEDVTSSKQDCSAASSDKDTDGGVFKHLNRFKKGLLRSRLQLSRDKKKTLEAETT